MKARNGHRWTQAELVELMRLWDAEAELDEIATAFGVTRFAVGKMVGRLRANGIPLKLRTRGHRAGRRNQSWTQAEVEYLVRRRKDRATAEQIAVELDRTFPGVQGMIAALRREEVPVQMLGSGVRRLWNADILRAQYTAERVS